MGKIQQAVADGLALRYRRERDIADQTWREQQSDLKQSQRDYDTSVGYMKQWIEATEKMRQGPNPDAIDPDWVQFGKSAAHNLDAHAESLGQPGHWRMMVDASLRSPTAMDSAVHKGKTTAAGNVAQGQATTDALGGDIRYNTPGVSVPTMKPVTVDGQQTMMSDAQIADAVSAGSDMSDPTSETAKPIWAYDYEAQDMRRVTDAQIAANPERYTQKTPDDGNGLPGLTEAEWMNVATVAGVDYEKIRTGTATPDEWERFNAELRKAKPGFAEMFVEMMTNGTGAPAAAAPTGGQRTPLLDRPAGFTPEQQRRLEQLKAKRQNQ